ncbi:hypothetical protein CKO38_12140 [Rhodospirillum rubrum]|uniref:response regulator n=1 Tax=Rhodospirillum rubrum TaxID=1085 RepID=UPI00190584D7|nr:response regulator [Rhodospirillum rubrum]MBK1663588.1 hypothetical protein [Rhodospirillum rubrum]MBK1677403.1 hypothetical protein [Rhodospirillum rubrum]
MSPSIPRPHSKPPAVLVVEDDPIIGLDLCETFTDLGYVSVHNATSVSQALIILETQSIALAVLDYVLERGATSLPVADNLLVRSIPYLFITGVSDYDGFGKGIPFRHAAAPRIEKPFVPTTLKATLMHLLQGRPHLLPTAGTTLE